MEKVNEYPLLADNTAVQALLNKIMTEKSILWNLEKDLGIEIGKIQQNCPHEKFSLEKGKHQWMSGNNNLLSKTCTQCGFKPDKPKGSSEKVCDKCWGEMEYQEREPGQGGGTHHYECKNCHHYHTST